MSLPTDDRARGERARDGVPSAAYALSKFVRRSHDLAPDDFHHACADAARDAGWSDVTVLMVDFDQRVLVPLPGADTASADVDGSLPGRCYRTRQPVRAPNDDGVQIWVPLL